jgi:hypothetical protein
MSIVVTGATGQLGRLVVASLLDRGVAATEIVATGRSSERLATLTELGVRTAELDYDDPDAAVFSADDVVLLVSGSEVGKRVEQHGKVIDAAARAGVARIVYTSVAHADDTTIVVAPEHVATEELLAASVLQHTILRNGWYSENYLPTFQQAQQGGAVLTSAGEGGAYPAPPARTMPKRQRSCSPLVDTRMRSTSSGVTSPGPWGTSRAPSPTSSVGPSSCRLSRLLSTDRYSPRPDSTSPRRTSWSSLTEAPLPTTSSSPPATCPD